MVAKQLTQDVIVIANAVTTDVEMDGASVATTVVSGSFSYYSSVAAWDAVMVVAVTATTAVIIAVFGSSFYYSSVAAWDAIADVAADATVDVAANFMAKAGMHCSPLL